MFIPRCPGHDLECLFFFLLSDNPLASNICVWHNDQKFFFSGQCTDSWLFLFAFKAMIVLWLSMHFCAMLVEPASWQHWKSSFVCFVAINGAPHIHLCFSVIQGAGPYRWLWCILSADLPRRLCWPSQRASVGNHTSPTAADLLGGRLAQSDLDCAIGSLSVVNDSYTVASVHYRLRCSSHPHQQGVPIFFLVV